MEEIGDLQIHLGMDTKDAEKQAEHLQKEVEKIFKSRSGEQSAALTNLELQMKKTYDSAKKLSDSLEDMKFRKANVEEFVKVQTELEKTQRQVNKLVEDINAVGKAVTSNVDKYTVTVDGAKMSIDQFYARIQQDEEKLSNQDWLSQHTTEDIEAMKLLVTQEHQAYDKMIEESTNIKVAYKGEEVTANMLIERLNKLKDTMADLSNQSAQTGVTGTVGEAREELDNLSVSIQEETKNLDLQNDKIKQQIIRHDEMAAKEVANYERIEQAAQKAEDAEASRQEKVRQANQREADALLKRIKQDQEKAKRKKAQEEADRFSTLRRSMTGLRSSIVGVERLLPGVSTKATSALFSISRGITMITQLATKAKVIVIEAIHQIGAALLANPLLGPAILATIVAVGTFIKSIQRLKKVWEAFKVVAGKTGQIVLGGLKKIPKQLANIVKLSLKLATIFERSIFATVKALISKLRSLEGTIRDNIDTMLKWGTGMEDINTAMSNLTSSLTYVKAALATAFAPILTTIEPLLTSMLDKIGDVTTALGIFIAQLTGQTTFQKAIRYQKDYAESIKDTNEQLANFDKLNVISTGDTAEDSGVKFETVDVEPLNLDFLGDLFDKAREVAEKFTEVINKIPWEVIKQGATDAAFGVSNFVNGFTSIEGLPEALGTALGETVNTIQAFFDGLFNEQTGISFDKLGESIGKFFSNAIDTISWKKLGKTLWDGLRSALRTVRGFLKSNPGTKLAKAFSDFLSGALGTANLEWTEIDATLKAVIDEIVSFLNGIITVDNFSLIGETFGNVVNSICTGASTFAKDAEWEQWGDAIEAAINTFFETWDPQWTANAINQWALGIEDMLVAAIDDIEWTLVGDKIITLLSGIKWEDIGAKALYISRQLRIGLESVWNRLYSSGAFDDLMGVVSDFFSEYEKWKDMLFKIKWDVIKSAIIEAWWKSSFIYKLGKELIEGITNFTNGTTTIENASTGRSVTIKKGDKLTKEQEDYLAGRSSSAGTSGTYGSTYHAGIGGGRDGGREEPIDDTTTGHTIVSMDENLNSMEIYLRNILETLSSEQIKNVTGVYFTGNLAGLTPEQIRDMYKKLRKAGYASGTVIPPTASEFLAKVGDNNRETEVISPLSTIKQALMEAMAEGSMQVTFKVEGDPNGIFKVVQKESVKYNQRTGNSAFA